MCREMSNSIKVIEMKSREKTRKEIKRVRIEEESKKNGVNLTKIEEIITTHISIKILTIRPTQGFYHFSNIK